MRLTDLTHPLAITMWDFSWLERRWIGGGFEDWGRALDELRERGYDAVRIDAFPHLLATDPDREWDLVPVWTEHDWGAPAPVRVQSIRSALIEFIGACRDRDLKVGLSSWYREDTADVRMRYNTPMLQADCWIATLDTIVGAGLGDQILYVDLANEWPISLFNPFAYSDGVAAETVSRAALGPWMDEAIGAVRSKHPDFDYCFSFATELTTLAEQDLKSFDLLEPHLWMTTLETSDFYDRIGYDLASSHNDRNSYLQLQHASAEYNRDPSHWQQALADSIHHTAAWSRDTGVPLITTECWSIVNWKDWPGLDWTWVKDLGLFGVQVAAQTGRWSAIASSNFCAPQFRGMWSDVTWHQQVTEVIHQAALPTT
ncbi:sugar-binding cellulase-like protein [Kribbella antiqua]|uniref:Sugar-binding cellulase-like protein n=1 Tax=Kribbella antiqua TaxID=2512217 RepID=A0A4R2IZZ1_9ACTN|nr:cellulase-like family protein [Kribbella antiqua]TCO49499.1 sugar-binding cellulase-like protein [Kribbella antiqua]